MTQTKEPRVKLPPVEQIGIVVNDVDKAIEFYTSVFGWGPFRVVESDIKGFSYRGKIGDARLKTALAKSGPVEIELIEVLDGETAHTDFIKEKGEGLHHLRFRVNDIDGIIAELAKDGVKPVMAKNFEEFGISFAYLDTEKTAGVMVELIEYKDRRINKE